MNPKKSTREIFRNVLSWLREKRGHTPSEVPLKTLKKAISHTRCRGEPPADPRTVRKWFRRFKEEGLIKNNGLNIWELVGIGGDLSDMGE